MECVTKEKLTQKVYYMPKNVKKSKNVKTKDTDICIYIHKSMITYLSVFTIFDTTLKHEV